MSKWLLNDQTAHQRDILEETEMGAEQGMLDTSGSDLARGNRRAERRRREILSLLGENSDGIRGMSVAELSDKLGVSVATVRRDLTQLENESSVSRTYGGAALAPGKRELTMSQRQMSASEQKRAIGEAAVNLLQPGDVVILDAGSTAERIAAAIDNRFELTVVTNGVRCINQLVGQDQVQVMVLGGHLRGINETICGGDAEEMLSRVHADFAFVGADAVDTERGIGSRTYDQSRLKSIMLRHATSVFVVADSSKLSDSSTYPFWSPLPFSWGLITDEGASRASLDRLRVIGANPIHIAPIHEKERE